MIGIKYSYLFVVLAVASGYSALEIKAKCPFKTVQSDGIAHITCPCDYGEHDEVKEGSTRWAFTQVNDGPATSIHSKLKKPKDTITLQRPLPALNKAVAISAEHPIKIQGNGGQPVIRSVDGVAEPEVSDLISY